MNKINNQTIEDTTLTECAITNRFVYGITPICGKDQIAMTISEYLEEAFRK